MSVASPLQGTRVTTRARTVIAGCQGLLRLVRIVLHIVRGVLIVRLRFGRLSSAQRHRHISAWSLRVLSLLRVDLHVQGELRAGSSLMVANHVSWLDVVVIHAVCPRARFVSKSVVGDWPLIGRLVAGVGTLMVDRQRRRDTARTLGAMEQALHLGDTVVVFPEGTTSDGARVLDFHASLLQSAVNTQVAVQPLALRYAEAGHALSTSVPYIGTTTFVESLWRICMARDLVATVRLLPAVAAPHTGRRALARGLRESIHAALDEPARIQGCGLV